jgi:hypothetical protein
MDQLLNETEDVTELKFMIGSTAWTVRKHKAVYLFRNAGRLYSCFVSGLSRIIEYGSNATRAEIDDAITAAVDYVAWTGDPGGVSLALPTPRRH